jgi:capsular polysaccharide biosynthesis protein
MSLLVTKETNMNEINQNLPLQPAHTEDEIDLIALAKTVWNGRKTIIKITIVFFIIGLFIAIFTPKKYSVTTVMVPQVTNGKSKLGGLSSLAAMAGFNLNMSSGSELSPNIYPQIVQSIPFQKELMYTKFNFEGFEEKISIYDYYTDPQYSKFNLLGFVKRFSIGLPGTILKAIRGKRKQSSTIFTNENNLTTLTIEEKKLTKLLDKIVYLNIEKKDGYITLTAIMPEALVAAQLGQTAQQLLQKYITEFKIEKAQAQLSFVEERYIEKKQAFKSAQKTLAQFRDQNKNVSTAIAQTEEEHLQSEYQIAQSVYNELAKQLESSRIQVKEETPVFSIIEPISVPTESFKPKRKQIVFIWIFLGVVFGIGWIFGKNYYLIFKEKWKE